MNKYIGVKLIDAEPTICCNKTFSIPCKKLWIIEMNFIKYK